MIERRLLVTSHRLTERQEKNLAILDLVRRKGPITRTELSQGTNLNIVTISNYVNEFIKEGLLVERGFDVSTGGRKPVLVELNANSAYAIGVDLGPMDLPNGRSVALITNLAGQIVHRVVKTRTKSNLESALLHVEELVDDVLKSSPVERDKIQGIGVGLPAIIDERAGTARHVSIGGVRTSYVTWRDQWEAQFKLPVFVGNDATWAGYGEFQLGLNRPVENMLYCYADYGASLVINGRVYWGASGSAGELGILLPNTQDYLAWVNTPSFMLTSDWELSLVSQARKLISEGHDTSLSQLVSGKPDAVDVDVILGAAQNGDLLSRQLIENTALQLGIRIASIVNLLNPEVVVIGGGIERAGSLLLEPVWQAVKRYAYEEAATLVDVLPAKLGENAVALGAASWVVSEIFIQA